MTTPIRLHVDTWFSSPYAMSVFVALHEKAVPFERVAVDLHAGEQRRAPFAALSLTRRVPTLEHDGFVLTESSAITEYLDEVLPGTPLYPRPLRDRARARQVQAWLRSDLMPIREERSAETVFGAHVNTPLSESARDAAGKLFAVAESLLAPGASHLFGHWCIADTDLAMMLQRLRANGDAMPARLAVYADMQWARPSMARWLALPR
jgi:glutathione S-transferase